MASCKMITILIDSQKFVNNFMDKELNGTTFKINKAERSIPFYIANAFRVITTKKFHTKFAL